MPGGPAPGVFWKIAIQKCRASATFASLDVGTDRTVGSRMNNSHPVGPGRSDQRRCSREIDRGGQVQFLFDGETITAHEGESIAAALLASRRRTLRYTSRRGEPRGVFCNMGICFDCLVEIDGRPNQRACQTPVTEGIEVRTQHGVGGRVQS